jgi:hypothetical protein
MTTAPQTKSALLENLANQFGPFPKQNRVLERHRLPVLTLRARGGTYPQIRKLLEMQGVLVSDTSLSRFCCKYAADVERLRLQVEQEIEGMPPTPAISSAPSVTPSAQTPISNSNPTLTPMSPSSRKMRDLRGDF